MRALRPVEFIDLNQLACDNCGFQAGAAFLSASVPFLVALLPSGDATRMYLARSSLAAPGLVLDLTQLHAEVEGRYQVWNKSGPRSVTGERR